METVNISLPMTEIETFCNQNHIRRLSLFGSVLRDDFTDESDVDILVEFESGKTPGLRIVSLQNRLSCLLGRVVDLRTAGDLSRYFRDEVLEQMRVIYEQNLRSNSSFAHKRWRNNCDLFYGWQN